MKITPREVLDRIEEVRRALGLTQRAFCEKIGFKVSTFSNMTGERRTDPSVDLLLGLASLPNVDIRWVLTGEGEMLRSEEPPAPEIPRRAPAQLSLLAQLQAELSGVDLELAAELAFLDDEVKDGIRAAARAARARREKREAR